MPRRSRRAPPRQRRDRCGPGRDRAGRRGAPPWCAGPRPRAAARCRTAVAPPRPPGCRARPHRSPPRAGRASRRAARRHATTPVRPGHRAARARSSRAQPRASLRDPRWVSADGAAASRARWPPAGPPGSRAPGNRRIAFRVAMGAVVRRLAAPLPRRGAAPGSSGLRRRSAGRMPAPCARGSPWAAGCQARNHAPGGMRPLERG